MASDTFVQVSRRDLNLELAMYVVFSGAAAFLAMRRIGALIDYYPAHAALNFTLVALLLFPAFRIWKQSRGHATPRFTPFLRTLVAVSLLIFAGAWLLNRGG